MSEPHAHPGLEEMAVSENVEREAMLNELALLLLDAARAEIKRERAAADQAARKANVSHDINSPES
jgi:hypothetical protein